MSASSKPRVEWRIHDNGRSTGLISDEQALSNIDYIRGNESYEVLLDVPGFFMWRYKQSNDLAALFGTGPTVYIREEST